jgi:hypothetical protein
MSGGNPKYYEVFGCALNFWLYDKVRPGRKETILLETALNTKLVGR